MEELPSILADRAGSVDMLVKNAQWRKKINKTSKGYEFWYLLL